MSAESKGSVATLDDIERIIDSLSVSRRENALNVLLLVAEHIKTSHGDNIIDTLDGALRLEGARLREYMVYERRLRSLLSLSQAVAAPALRAVDQVYEAEVAHCCFVCMDRFVNGSDLDAHLRERHHSELLQKLATLKTLADSVAEHAKPLYSDIPRLQIHVEAMLTHAHGEQLVRDVSGFLLAARNFLEVVAVKLCEHLGLTDTTPYMRLEDFLGWLKTKVPPARINPFYAAKTYSTSTTALPSNSQPPPHAAQQAATGESGRTTRRSSLDAAALTLHALHQTIDEAKGILQMPPTRTDRTTTGGTENKSRRDETVSPSHLLGSLHNDMGAPNMSMFESMLPSSSTSSSKAFDVSSAAFTTPMGGGSLGGSHVDLSQDWSLDYEMRARERRNGNGAASNTDSLAHSLAHNPMHHLYKTMLCKHWESSATCPRGAECNFAHGGVELRRARCKFYPLGKCKKGDQCPFLHE